MRSRAAVVVTWDGRGIGRSYATYDPNLMQRDVVSDTIELADYLRERFDEERIYLFGESGGSITGVLAAKRAPERFHAWIGSGQMVDPRETDRRIWADLHAWAREHDDAALLDQLDEVGRPPYDDPLTYAWVMGHYDKLEGDLDPPEHAVERQRRSGVGFMGLGGSEYAAIDKVNAVRGLIARSSTRCCRQPMAEAPDALSRRTTRTPVDSVNRCATMVHRSGTTHRQGPRGGAAVRRAAGVARPVSRSALGHPALSGSHAWGLPDLGEWHAEERRKRSSPNSIVGAAMPAREFTTMTLHTFEIYFDASVDDLDSAEGIELLDSLVAAGLDDATFAQVHGRWLALVDREGSTFVDAVMSALSDIERGGGTASQVLPEDLVTASEIAERHGKTRQWVNQLVNGTRGRGDFPAPFRGAGPVAQWRWADIERYFADDPAPDPSALQAESTFLETLNAALEFRNRSRSLARMAREDDARRVVQAVLIDMVIWAA